MDGEERERDIPRERHISIERPDLTKWTEIISIPPKIPMDLSGMTILENQIKEKGMHPNEKSPSKSSRKKSKKVHNKADKTTVA